MAEVVWTPDGERLASANLTRLMGRLGVERYADLHRISIDEPERFWRELVADLGLVLSRPWDEVLDSSDGIQWARWFVGARLNLAESCVHRWARERPDDEALVGLFEDGTRSSLTWEEASLEVRKLAEALVELGVEPGDRVALFMPMCPAVAIAAHACAHVGAVQVPIFSGFAAPAIAQRLEDAEAKVVLCADWSLRRGQRIEMLATLGEALRGGEEVLTWSRERHGWPELVERQPGRLEPVEVDAEHPYLLAYTSGTTGRPKGAVHVHGGFLVSIAREVAYQADVRAGERIHFVTDMGWIMGPWTVVGGGAVGATIVLAEGAPDFPADRLWRTIESERVTMLGVSPTLIRSLLPRGEPQADLSSLRSIATTGEPWNPAPYRWLHERVGGGRVPIVNLSGGTEVGACFLSVVVTEPIKECSLGFPALGLDMDVFDQEGNPLRGEVGELVCKRPWPGMTRGVWGDPERYLETYWRRFPGVWRHGDWASIDEDGYWYLHGRSDDTLNIAGKRIGPAELESAATGHPAVAEVAAVGVPHELKGEVAWLFCVLKPGIEPSEELAREVTKAVTNALGRAFKPERVEFVGSLPKTRSAKIMRRAVRAKALGEDLGDLSSLENPEALEEIARVV
ncbi:MAG: AMP-binding protein [Gaiellaceae bacterium]